MLQRLFLILWVLIPFVVSAQSIQHGTPEYERIVKDDCDGKIFTKSEELPSFKISKQAFEDSLTLYLKANQAFEANAKYSLQFVLTRESHILDLQKLRGAVPSPGVIKAFLQSSKLWFPAKQNGREVCAFVKCNVEVKEERLSVRIFQ